MPLLPIMLMLVAGVALALQGPTNGALAKATGSVLLASLTSFVIGTLALLAVWALANRTAPAALRQAPGWTLIGGFYGAAFVAALAYAAPRLGITVALTLAIASQLAAALVLDHFGLLGLRLAPVSAIKLAGVSCMVAGVVLVQRG